MPWTPSWCGAPPPPQSSAPRRLTRPGLGAAARRGRPRRARGGRRGGSRTGGRGERPVERPAARASTTRTTPRRSASAGASTPRRPGHRLPAGGATPCGSTTTRWTPPRPAQQGPRPLVPAGRLHPLAGALRDGRHAARGVGPVARDCAGASRSVNEACAAPVSPLPSATLTVLSLAASGCGGSSDAAPSPVGQLGESGRERHPHADAHADPVAVPTATLTGLPGADGPVLVVKIDNAASRPAARRPDARPTWCTSRRSRAGSPGSRRCSPRRYPDLIGPVRSARAHRPRPCSSRTATPAFAFSGANPVLRKQIRSADLIDLGADRLSKVQYFRKKGWSAPQNLFADGSELIAAVGRGRPAPGRPGLGSSPTTPPRRRHAPSRPWRSGTPGPRRP